MKSQFALKKALMVTGFSLTGSHARAAAFLLIAGLALGPVAMELRADSPTHQTPPPEDAPEDPCDEGNNGKEDCEKCPKEEPENKEKCPTKGDPFHLGNGEFFLRKSFLSQAAANSPKLHFTPYYSSFSDANGVLGHGWTFNLRMQLYESSDGLLVVRKSNGKRYRYQLSGGIYKLKDLPNSETITIQGSGSSLKYLLQTRSHDWFRFDAEGRLEALGDDHGEEQRLTYDPEKMPVTAVPRASNITTPMVVVRDWRISRVDSYRGGTATGTFLQFGYHATTGLLSWVKDQAARQIDLTYNAQGQLQAIEDPADNGYAFTYDSQGRMETFASPGCSSCILTRNYYDSLNRVYKQTQGDANQGTETSVTFGSLYTDVTHKIKNAAGTVIRQWDERTTFSTDSFGRKRVVSVEAKRGASFGAAENHKTSYTYFTSGAHAGKIQTTTSPNGSVETNVFGTNGRLQSVTRTVGGGVNLVTEYEYDGNLNKTKETVYQSDAPLVKFITEWTYDGSNRMTAEKRKQADGSYVTTSYAYYTTGVHAGLLKTRTDACDNATEYEYTAAADAPAPVGLLKREYDPARPVHQTTYGYDAAGNRTSKTDALGRSTTWEYDAKNRMLREVRPDLGETVNTYVGANLVETKAGNLTVGWRTKRFQYNGLNQRIKVLRVNDAGQEVVQMTHEYDSDGNILKSFDALNQATVYEYDAMGWLTKVKQPYDGTLTSDTTFTYDKAGRVVSQMDAIGTITETVYDLLDRKTSITEAKTFPEQRTTEQSYDALGKVSEIRYKNVAGVLAATTKYYYDLLGRKTGINWNPANAEPDTTGARELPRKMEYDGCGNLTASIDGRGNRTSYEYDAYDRQTKILFADRLTYSAPRYNDVEMAYDEVGNLVRTTDGRGTIRHYHYDAMNQRSHESVPVATALTGNWWNTQANVLRSTTYNFWGRPLTTTSLAGGNTATTYDAFGRLTTRTDAAGLSLTYVYNALDQPLEIQYPALGGQAATKISYAYHPNNGTLVNSLTDRAGNVTSFSYDLLLRRDRIRGSLNQPAGPEKVTVYDRLGRIQTQTDEAGNVTTTTYDLFNQALNVTLPDHTVGSPRIQTFTYNAYGQALTQSGAGDYPVTHTYDLAGNRLTLVTQYGAANTNQTTSWAYDSRNRLSRKTYADNTFYDYTYDENGNLKTRTDAKNQTTGYSYNLFNQVATVDYPADSDVAFAYDAGGRRLSMSDGSHSGAPSAEWAYDAAGRIATYKQHPVDRIIRYGYNAEGGRISMSVEKISTPGDPWTTAYTYDAAGRLDTVTDSRVGEVPFDYTWDPKANLVKEILMPSGAKQQKTYDALARLSEIKALNGIGTSVNRYAYSYDAAGQRKDVTLVDNGKITYGYDAKRQVTSAVKDNEADYNYSYTFDDIGNWLTGKTGQTSGVPLSKTFTPNNLNQYSQVSGVPLTYDANGNLTYDGTNTYTYDQENRLTAVAGASFTYDGLSRRVASGATKLLYDGVVPIAELDADNNCTRTVTRGLDLANSFQRTGGVGGILATVTSGVRGYYFYDGNGNVVDVLDGAHAIIAHYAYDPFGNKVVESGAYAAQPYQWSTKEFDATSGLIYYLFRFYSPQIGRWISRDPIEEKGGVNLYGMIGNKVVNKFDKFGLIEVGVGPTASVGGHFYLVGIDVSVGGLVTSLCRVCVSAAITVILGPGLGVHGGVGPNVSGSMATLDGPSVSFGGGGWIATPDGGASGAVDIGLTPTPDGGAAFTGGAAGGKGELGAGLAVGLRFTASCTGCASITKSGWLAPVDAAKDLWDCITNFKSKWANLK